jgi:hypothetical protein
MICIHGNCLYFSITREIKPVHFVNQFLLNLQFQNAFKKICLMKLISIITPKSYVQKSQIHVPLYLVSLVYLGIMQVHSTIVTCIYFFHFPYALDPAEIGLHGPKRPPQAWSATEAILVASRPALQTFANARMCFMPYCVSTPQLDSKVRTWIQKVNN